MATVQALSGNVLEEGVRVPVGKHPSMDFGEMTLSGVLAYFRRGERHRNVGSSATETYAALVYRAILKSSNWPGSIDKRVAAGRIRRQILKAAAHDNASAVALKTAHALMVGMAGHPKVESKAKGLDTSK
jgi:hypothetical protein